MSAQDRSPVVTHIGRRWKIKRQATSQAATKCVVRLCLGNPWIAGRFPRTPRHRFGNRFRFSALFLSIWVQGELPPLSQGPYHIDENKTRTLMVRHPFERRTTMTACDEPNTSRQIQRCTAVATGYRLRVHKRLQSWLTHSGNSMSSVDAWITRIGVLPRIKIASFGKRTTERLMSASRKVDPESLTDRKKAPGSLCCQGLLSVEYKSSIRDGCTLRYAEKLLPHPHDFTAFGFLNVKPRFSRPV